MSSKAGAGCAEDEEEAPICRDSNLTTAQQLPGTGTMHTRHSNNIVIGRGMSTVLKSLPKFRPAPRFHKALFPRDVATLRARGCKHRPTWAACAAVQPLTWSRSVRHSFASGSVSLAQLLCSEVNLASGSASGSAVVVQLNLIFPPIVDEPPFQNMIQCHVSIHVLY